MATKQNPANENRSLAVYQQGVVGYDDYRFDLSASYASGAAADETIIVLGYVPADCKLIPHLCHFTIPQLDSNGAPTGDFEIGTVAVPAALHASAAAETAVVWSGEDLIDADIGSQTEDVAITLRVVNVIATLGTGTIKSKLAYRAWNPRIDS